MIQIQNLSIRQGTFALFGVSLEVPPGRYAVLMGRSGCGKTTILETIAGLRAPHAGTIALAGRDVTRLRPAARHVGYVPQDGVLFSTMTVRQNIGFALDVRGAPLVDTVRRVAELADWLEVTHLLDRYPRFLSGGEKNRVALGRALANRPPVLLLDEPLASLDDDTRDHLIAVLARLRERREVTVLHVTHNRSEADRLADVVFRLDSGKVLEMSC
ncbi:ABC transporter ATP-binding protein [Gemmata sp. JC673]|uniref:ABC transporter ATP-binding protein n=1 Tax=Gemmata algarum TaxID=2975278 RepID=A0ABU5EW95_9BACT|nr:ABC transporter ATP-binding protein [Gemmata algarum]MDY3559441.1 ABC transporter ATP-binding protein [Gemmata algarum]